MLDIINIGGVMNNIFKFFRESRTARMLIPMGIMFIVIGVFLFIIDNNTKNFFMFRPPF